MPDFGSPVIPPSNTPVTDKEQMSRMVRFAIAGELEAINQYQIIAESVDDNIVKQTVQSISDEEKVHVGELLRVLSYLDENEPSSWGRGSRETQERINEKAREETNP